MKLTKRQLITAQQAFGYAVMYAKTESETAEFALLKMDIEKELIKSEQLEAQQAEHDTMGCVFNYCSQNPKCEGKCYLAND